VQDAHYCVRYYTKLEITSLSVICVAQVELCRKRLCLARQSVFHLIGNVYSRECAEHTLFFALETVSSFKKGEKEI